jgi:hypothetical protein
MSIIDSFKIGDFVSVRDGVVIESDLDIITEGWCGTITELRDEDGLASALVKLDAVTLKKLPEDYFFEGYRLGYDSYSYYFLVGDITASTPRSSEAEYNEVQERIKQIEQFNDYLDEFESKEEAYADLLHGIFTRSEVYIALDEKMQRYASLAVKTLLNELFEVEEKSDIKDWSVKDVKEVCLKHIPENIPASAPFFEALGDNLILFFQFLEHIELIEAQPFIDSINQYKEEIAIRSANPKSWQPTKKKMIAAGMDLAENTAEELMDIMGIDPSEIYGDYDSFDDEDYSSSFPFKPIEQEINPYRHIGRNDRISVKYSDGRVIENVKFKKVEADLKAGKCKLI